MLSVHIWLGVVIDTYLLSCHYVPNIECSLALSGSRMEISEQPSFEYGETPCLAWGSLKACVMLHLLEMQTGAPNSN